MPAAISVLIPSRLAKTQLRNGPEFFYERALRSVELQTAASSHRIRAIIGVDAGIAVSAPRFAGLDVAVAVSEQQSQAAALNAAAKYIEGDYVAILEDDDEWEPDFVEQAITALDEADFVSSTQLEFNPAGEVLRINDFPTPSGWIMRRTTWEAVGGFDAKFRWHLDNEWLGRLNERKFQRIHLVEATAPVILEEAVNVRPWLANVLRFGGQIRLRRHASFWPLVKRLVHPESGMQQVGKVMAFGIQSREEQANLIKRYGRIPW